jgi:hypothetical protein
MGGSLRWNEIKDIVESCNYSYKYFIETGTYKGETIFEMSKYFDKLYTIEIDNNLYNECLIKNKDNIEMYLGDSLIKLPYILEKVIKDINYNKESLIVFFIDAHISGSDSSWNNKDRVPIYEELDIILKKKLSNKCIYIIDDVNLWKNKVWDWSHITNDNIINKFIENNYSINSFYENNDRYYVITNN